MYPAWPGSKAFKGKGDQKGKALGTRLGEFKADMVGGGGKRDGKEMLPAVRPLRLDEEVRPVLNVVLLGTAELLGSARLLSTAGLAVPHGSS